MKSTYTPPGRLGSNDMNVASDPRTRPDLLSALRAMELDQNVEVPPLDRKDKDALAEMCKLFNNQTVALYESLPNKLPGDVNEPEVEQSEISIDGPDGNKIKLYIYRPKTAETKTLPGVVYIHGGGMTVIPTTAKPHLRWMKSLAQGGVVSIAIDFRNAWTPEGKYNPFPVGLNDCAAAVKYIDSHRSELGISKFILQGESGGANLSIATAIKAKREGWVDAIAGVYALAPYVAGPEGYGWSIEKKVKELPSMVENNGYFLHMSPTDAMAYYYHPVDDDLTNPLAWPYHATEKDLKGLPPHIISVDELDPLRDEGIALYRKLQAAGVRVTGDMNLGILHGASMIFRQAIPDMHEKALRQITTFAKSVSGNEVGDSKLSRL